MMAPLHSSLGNRVRPCLKKTKNKKHLSWSSESRGWDTALCAGSLLGKWPQRAGQSSRGYKTQQTDKHVGWVHHHRGNCSSIPRDLLRSSWNAAQNCLLGAERQMCISTDTCPRLGSRLVPWVLTPLLPECTIRGTYVDLVKFAWTVWGISGWSKRWTERVWSGCKRCSVKIFTLTECNALTYSTLVHHTHTSGGPLTRGLWGQNYFPTTAEMFLSFSSLFSHEYTAELSRGFVTGTNVTDWMHTQVWEPAVFHEARH